MSSLLSQIYEGKELTIDDVLPDDKDYRKYMDIADGLDSKTYNKFGKIVKEFLDGTHFTESDYKAGVGFMYSHSKK